MNNQLSEKQASVLELLTVGNGKFSYSTLDDFSCMEGGHDERPLVCNCKSGYYAEEIPGEHVGIWEFETMLYSVNIRTLRSLEKVGLVEWVDGHSGRITASGRGIIQAAV